MSSPGWALFGGPAIASMTVSDLIYTAYRISGVLGNAGRGAATAEITDGLNCLNSMIDSWNTESLIIYSYDRREFDTLAGTGSYSIGPAGSWQVTRPVRILTAGVMLTASSANPVIEFPVQVLYSYQEWAQVRLKALQSTIPQAIYYNGEWPEGVIHIYPVPSVAQPIVLYLATQISGFADAGDTVSLPPGYQRALEYNLAAELAIRFPGRAKMMDRAWEIARDSKAAIKSANQITYVRAVDAALVGPREGYFNWRTGE